MGAFGARTLDSSSGAIQSSISIGNEIRAFGNKSSSSLVVFMYYFVDKAIIYNIGNNSIETEKNAEGFNTESSILSQKQDFFYYGGKSNSLSSLDPTNLQHSSGILVPTMGLNLNHILDIQPGFEENLVGFSTNVGYIHFGIVNSSQITKELNIGSSYPIKNFACLESYHIIVAAIPAIKLIKFYDPDTGLKLILAPKGPVSSICFNFSKKTLGFQPEGQKFIVYSYSFEETGSCAASNCLSCPDSKICDKCVKGFFFKEKNCVECPFECPNCTSELDCGSVSCNWLSEYLFEGRCKKYASLAENFGVDRDNGNRTINCETRTCKNCRLNSERCWDPPSDSAGHRAVKITSSIEKIANPILEFFSGGIGSLLGAIPLNFVFNSFFKNELAILSLLEVEFGIEAEEIAKNVGSSFKLYDNSLNYVTKTKRLTNKLTKHKIRVNGVREPGILTRLIVFNILWVFRIFRTILIYFYKKKISIGKIGMGFIFYSKMLHFNIFLIVYPYILFHCSRFFFFYRENNSSRENLIFNIWVKLNWIAIVFDLVYLTRNILFANCKTFQELEKKNIEQKEQKTEFEICKEKTLFLTNIHNEGIYTLLVSNLTLKAMRSSKLARFQVCLLFEYIGIYIILIIGMNFKLYTKFSLIIISIVLLLDLFSYIYCLYQKHFADWVLIIDRTLQLLFHFTFIAISWIKIFWSDPKGYIENALALVFYIFLTGQNLMLLMNLVKAVHFFVKDWKRKSFYIVFEKKIAKREKSSIPKVRRAYNIIGADRRSRVSFVGVDSIEGEENQMQTVTCKNSSGILYRKFKKQVIFYFKKESDRDEDKRYSRD